MTGNESEIENLIAQLGDPDGIQRQTARERLVEIGGFVVTRALVIELNDPRRDVRWEAAKALVAIADPITAPALVRQLLDEDGDIRWLAAEGLISLGEPGLLVTLSTAVRNAGNTEFCEAAHHVFKEFRKHGSYGKLLDPVIAACEENEPGVSLPVAAFHLLEQIKVKS